MNWVPCKVRLPTKADEDESGQVLVQTGTGSLALLRRHNINSFDIAWLSIPKYTPITDPPDGYQILTDYDAAWHKKTMYWVRGFSEWRYPPPHHAPCYNKHLIYAVPVTPPEPQYRPFANAEEFKPYRNRWWRNKGSERLMPPSSYSDTNFASCDWQHAFESLEFECGHPFGVKIQD